MSLYSVVVTSQNGVVAASNSGVVAAGSESTAMAAVTPGVVEYA